MAVIRKHSYKFLTLSLALCMGAFWFSLVDTSHGAQVTSRSDTLNNAAPSATSNHAITFKVQNSVYSDGSLNGTTASNTVSVTFPSDFNLGTITCNDLDLNINGSATSLNVSNGGTGTTCLNGATSWGALIDSTNRIITLTSPTSAASYVWVATGVPITISIGSNATFQGNGTHWITNTTSAGTKSINIAGTFGGTGIIDVAIIQSVQISATIAETLTFAINGLPGEAFSGTDKMTGCTSIANNVGSGFALEDEDGTGVWLVTTTAAAVPFGTLANNAFTEGCQRLEVRTNAGNGYTINSRDNNPLQTLGGSVIDDTICDNGACTPTTAAALTSARGLGISCVNSATSASCSTSNPNWNAGINWAPISADGKGLSPAKFSGVSGASSGLILAKVKYRLWPPASTPAGTYTNLVSFIVTPVY